MSARHRLLLKSFINFCTIAFICFNMNVLVFEVPVQGENQGQEFKNRNVDRKDDEEHKTIRTDLGGGLESILVIHFENGREFATLNKFKRHGTDVMSYSYYPTMGIGTRKYYQNGKVTMYEEFDSEGRIGILFILNADGSPAEVFERQEDGTTLPISTKRLEEMKQGGKFAKELFDPIADAVENENEKEAKRLISKAIEELNQGVAPPKIPIPAGKKKGDAAH